MMMCKSDLPLKIKDVLRGRRPCTLGDESLCLTHAAVLLPIFKDDGGYRLLFTRRTNRVVHHKGQISFPGGAVDEEDRSFLETALREAHEEIGLTREDVQVLGQLDDTQTVVSKFIIHPFVGLIPYPYNFRLNTREVKQLIDIPLELFFDEDTLNKSDHCEVDGVVHQTPAYHYNGDLIWGATARIMENFVEVIRERLTLPMGIEQDMFNS